MLAENHHLPGLFEAFLIVGLLLGLVVAMMAAGFVLAGRAREGSRTALVAWVVVALREVATAVFSLVGGGSSIVVAMPIAALVGQVLWYRKGKADPDQGR